MKNAEWPDPTEFCGHRKLGFYYQKLYSKSDNKVICANKELNRAMMFEFLIKRNQIKVYDFGISDVVQTGLYIRPKEFEKLIPQKGNATGKYAAGGALIGGLSGLLVGSAVEGLLNALVQKKYAFNIYLQFNLKGNKKIKYDHVNTLVSYERGNVKGFEYWVRGFDRTVRSVLNFTQRHFDGTIWRLSDWQR